MLLNKICILNLVSYSLSFTLLIIISTYPKADSHRIYTFSRMPIRLQVLDAKNGLRNVEMQNNGTHYFFYPVSPDGKVLPKDPLLEDPEPHVGRWIQAGRGFSSEEEGFENFTSDSDYNQENNETIIDIKEVKSPDTQEKSFNQSNLKEMGQSFNKEVEEEEEETTTAKSPEGFSNDQENLRYISHSNDRHHYMDRSLVDDSPSDNSYKPTLGYYFQSLLNKTSNLNRKMINGKRILNSTNYFSSNKESSSKTIYGNHKMTLKQFLDCKSINDFMNFLPSEYETKEKMTFQNVRSILECKKNQTHLDLMQSDNSTNKTLPKEQILTSNMPQVGLSPLTSNIESSNSGLENSWETHTDIPEDNNMTSKESLSPLEQESNKHHISGKNFKKGKHMKNDSDETSLDTKISKLDLETIPRASVYENLSTPSPLDSELTSNNEHHISGKKFKKGKTMKNDNDEASLDSKTNSSDLESKPKTLISENLSPGSELKDQLSNKHQVSGGYFKRGKDLKNESNDTSLDSKTNTSDVEYFPSISENLMKPKDANNQNKSTLSFEYPENNILQNGYIISVSDLLTKISIPKEQITTPNLTQSSDNDFNINRSTGKDPASPVFQFLSKVDLPKEQYMASNITHLLDSNTNRPVVESNISLVSGSPSVEIISKDNQTHISQDSKSNRSVIESEAKISDSSSNTPISKVQLETSLESKTNRPDVQSVTLGPESHSNESIPQEQIYISPESNTNRPNVESASVSESPPTNAHPNEEIINKNSITNRPDVEPVAPVIESSSNSPKPQNQILNSNETQLLDSNSNGNASTLTVDHLVFEPQANIPNPEENNLAAQLIKISSPLGFEKLKKFNHGFNFKRILENHKKPYYKIIVNGKLINITHVFRKNPNSKQVNVIFVKYNEMQNPRPITKQLRESFAKNLNFRKGKGPPSPTSLPKSHILNETENQTCISFQTYSDRRKPLAIIYGKSQSSCPKEYPCQKFNSCLWWATGFVHNDNFTLNQPVYLSYLMELFKGIQPQNINQITLTFDRCYWLMNVLDTPEYTSYRNQFTNLRSKIMSECENKISLFRSCLLLTESKGICSNKV